MYFSVFIIDDYYYYYYLVLFVCCCLVEAPHMPNMSLTSHMPTSHVPQCGHGLAIQTQLCQRQTTAIGNQHARKNNNLIMESNADSVEAMMEAGAVAVAWAACVPGCEGECPQSWDQDLLGQTTKLLAIKQPWLLAVEAWRLPADPLGY